VKVGDLVIFQSTKSPESIGLILDIHKQFILIKLSCGWYGWVPEIQYEVISERR